MTSAAPDWAMAEAAALRSAVIWQSNAANEIIALALVAAEKRGMERAAEITKSVSESYGMDESGWFECCETVEASILQAARSTP